MVKKTFKYIIYVVITLLVFSCNKYADQKTTLIGNWYYLDMYCDTNYNELYINDSLFIYYLNKHGFLSPQKYMISADSIVFFKNLNCKSIRLDYSPKFYIINENKFIIEHNMKTTVFNRIDNQEVNIDSLNYEYDETLFRFHFYKRRSRFLLKLGLSIDTSINSFFIEETIEP